MDSGASRAKEMTGKVLGEFLALATVTDKAKKKEKEKDSPFGRGSTYQPYWQWETRLVRRPRTATPPKASPRKTEIKKKRGWTILSL